MAKLATENTLNLLLQALGRAKKANPSATATIDTASAKVISANKKRAGLILTNTGANPVYLGISELAVANQGIYISGNGGVWIMDNFTFTNKTINAIAIGGATNIAIQEFE